jgi:hypothetical protein
MFRTCLARIARTSGAGGQMKKRDANPEQRQQPAAGHAAVSGPPVASAPSERLWDSLGKRIGVIAAAVALTASLGSGALWFYQKVWNQPTVVLRQRKWTQTGKSDQFDLHFSFLNPRDEPVYLNSMYLLEGTLTVGTGFGLSMTVPEHYDEVEINDLRLDSGGGVDSIKVATRSSRGRRTAPFEYVPHMIFTAGRIRIESKEEVDYHLVVRVVHPGGLNLKELKDPQIQAELVAEWETVDGKGSSTRCNANLLYW